MFEDGNMSPADFSAMMNNGNMNGGSWLWLILIFFLCGNGGLWGNNGRQVATTQDLADQFNFSALERQNNETVAAVRQGVYDVTGAVKDMGYMNSNSIRDVEGMVQNINGEISNCCCTTQRNIDSVRYDNAMNTQALLASNCEQTQKILDAISGNRIADMQNQINQLQLSSALANVPRIPVPAFNVGYPYGLYGTTIS